MLHKCKNSMAWIAIQMDNWILQTRRESTRTWNMMNENIKFDKGVSNIRSNMNLHHSFHLIKSVVLLIWVISEKGRPQTHHQSRDAFYEGFTYILIHLAWIDEFYNQNWRNSINFLHSCITFILQVHTPRSASAMS